MKTEDSPIEDVDKSAATVDCHSYKGLSEDFFRWLSRLSLVLMAVLVAGYAILVLYVPRIVVVWKGAGVDLTPAQQCLVRCSEFAVQNGAAIAIVVLSCFVLAFLLRIYCASR